MNLGYKWNRHSSVLWTWSLNLCRSLNQEHFKLWKKGFGAVPLTMNGRLFLNAGYSPGWFSKDMGRFSGSEMISLKLSMGRKATEVRLISHSTSEVHFFPIDIYASWIKILVLLIETVSKFQVSGWAVPMAFFNWQLTPAVSRRRRSRIPVQPTSDGSKHLSILNKPI